MAAPVELPVPAADGQGNEYPDILYDNSGNLWISYLSVSGRYDGIFAKYLTEFSGLQRYRSARKQVLNGSQQ